MDARRASHRRRGEQVLAPAQAERQHARVAQPAVAGGEELAGVDAVSLPGIRLGHADEHEVDVAGAGLGQHGARIGDGEPQLRRRHRPARPLGEPRHHRREQRRVDLHHLHRARTVERELGDEPLDRAAEQQRARPRRGLERGEMDELLRRDALALPGQGVVDEDDDQPAPLGHADPAVGRVARRHQPGWLRAVSARSSGPEYASATASPASEHAGDRRHAASPRASRGQSDAARTARSAASSAAVRFDTPSESSSVASAPPATPPTLSIA